MSNFRINKFLYIAALVLPATAFAQSYRDSTSMEVLAFDNTPARDCYQDASIAARIHYTSRKNLENCTYALTRTAMSPRDRAATLANRGIIYMSLDEFAMAVEDYNKAIALKPELGELNINIGNVFYMGDAYDRAITEYTTALEKNTTKPYVAHFNRGMAYENLKNYARAESDYKTAMEMMPEWTAPKTKLAELQQKKNLPATGTNTPNP